MSLNVSPTKAVHVCTTEGWLRPLRVTWRWNRGERSDGDMSVSGQVKQYKTVVNLSGQRSPYRARNSGLLLYKNRVGLGVKCDVIYWVGIIVKRITMKLKMWDINYVHNELEVIFQNRVHIQKVFVHVKICLDNFI